MIRCAIDMNEHEDRVGRRVGAVARFIEEKLKTGRITFNIGELLSKTGLSAIAAKNQLQRMRSHVVRVSRPHAFFLIVEPQYHAMGAPPVEWWLDDYFRWLGHPYYLALLSAAETYNSSPQAIQFKHVITDCPRRDVTIGRLRIRFFVKSRIELTPVLQPPTAYAPLRVSTPEATALDLVRYASRIGGIGRALETLIPLLPVCRASGIRRALDAEGEVAIAQRFGYLIDTAGQSRLAKVVHDWLPRSIVSASLGPAKQALSETIESGRWRLVVPKDGAWL